MKCSMRGGGGVPPFLASDEATGSGRWKWGEGPIKYGAAVLALVPTSREHTLHGRPGTLEQLFRHTLIYSLWAPWTQPLGRPLGITTYIYAQVYHPHAHGLHFQMLAFGPSVHGPRHLMPACHTRCMAIKA